MPAIITDQFRILNAETFSQSFTGIGTTTNYYYTFLGHPQPTFTGITDYGDSDWGLLMELQHLKIRLKKRIYIMIACFS